MPTPDSLTHSVGEFFLLLLTVRVHRLIPFNLPAQVLGLSFFAGGTRFSEQGFAVRTPMITFNLPRGH